MCLFLINIVRKAIHDHNGLEKTEKQRNSHQWPLIVTAMFIKEKLCPLQSMETGH